MPPKRKPIIDRILSKVSYQHGCWIYNGYRLPGGYGLIGSGGAKASGTLVHRAVYQDLVGPIPVGAELDHLCRNRSCCCPLHLEPVTRLENVARGIGNKDRCRFSKEQIFQMKEMSANGLTQETIARSFGVTRAMISRLIRDQAGSSVTGILNALPSLPVCGERTHCPQGHPYIDGNVIRQGGRRLCRMCRNEQSRAYYHARKASTS